MGGFVETTEDAITLGLHNAPSRLLHKSGSRVEADLLHPEFLAEIKNGDYPHLKFVEGESSESSIDMSALGGGGSGPSADPDQYDPDQHNAPDVVEYLKNAAPEEVERVKALEASKQNRKQIAQFEAGA